MKKIAMVGDLHGNLTATLAMEKALKDYHVDEIWFLGDAVGKGPQSRETCDWVRANCTRFVGGNWDYGIGGTRFAADNYFWDQLGEERMNWLNTLPLDMDEWISGTHSLFPRPPCDGLDACAARQERSGTAFHSEWQSLRRRSFCRQSPSVPADAGCGLHRQHGQRWQQHGCPESPRGDCRGRFRLA
ncbi:MAG: metallophosphoesterase family protein [Christensenellales bacterium]